MAYRAKGDNERAIADYNEVVRLDPRDARIFTNRGFAYFAKGGHDRAIADFSEAIRLDKREFSGALRPTLPSFLLPIRR